MEVVILRHGTTELNKLAMIQGSSVDPSLSEDGRQFAQKAAQNFNAAQFDVVYASPLKRAQETARIFAGNKEIITDDRLKEMDYGSWDGKASSDLKKKYPDAFDSQGLTTDNMYKYAADIEARSHLESRLVDFFEDIYQKHPDDKVLVVCHGVVARMTCAHYLTNGDISYFGQMDNCNLTKLYFKDDLRRLIFYNRSLVNNERI
ncbi:putative phosphoglycerate mutase [Lactobacillus colini]|uniref:Phosphoglycerate mutase n=1 Tax=Lactobacillus colini TaxID=1819254 RepID=A0ABS4MET8_9LACO|nr:histidine phosphatase family protein [Lactobacillus colini]MBP2058169.1 putative phosphoglycerate mutase [Lactobacillus colini]